MVWLCYGLADSSFDLVANATSMLCASIHHQVVIRSTRHVNREASAGDSVPSSGHLYQQWQQQRRGQGSLLSGSTKPVEEKGCNWSKEVHIVMHQTDKLLENLIVTADSASIVLFLPKPALQQYHTSNYFTHKESTHSEADASDSQCPFKLFCGSSQRQNIKAPKRRGRWRTVLQ